MRTIACSALLSLFCVLTAGCGDDDSSPGPAADTGADVVTDGPASDGAVDAPVTGDSGPQLGRIDRAGRPLTSVLLVASSDRGAWNEAYDSYELSSTNYQFDVGLQSALVKTDKWDGQEQWNGGAVPPAGADGGPGILSHPLGAWVKADALLLDVSKPFSPSGYLDIERGMLGISPAHATCGGRWLADDAVDKTLSLYVAKAASGVSDGVAEATKPPSETFPYLADPN